MNMETSKVSKPEKVFPTPQEIMDEAIRLASHRLGTGITDERVTAEAAKLMPIVELRILKRKNPNTTPIPPDEILDKAIQMAQRELGLEAKDDDVKDLAVTKLVQAEMEIMKQRKGMD